MGQIKNIKLHIVTDIKKKEQVLLEQNRKDIEYRCHLEYNFN